MDAVKAFFIRLGKAAQNLAGATVAALKALPFVRPLLALAYSRKAMISAGLVAFILDAFPKLAPVKDEMLLVALQVVALALVAAANILGIAIEDAATNKALRAG